jgi:hypothetical protein
MCRNLGFQRGSRLVSNSSQVHDKDSFQPQSHR